MSDRPKWTPPKPGPYPSCQWCGAERTYIGDAGERFCCQEHEHWFVFMERAARDLYAALVRLSLETREYLTDRATDEALAQADAALAKARGE